MGDAYLVTYIPCPRCVLTRGGKGSCYLIVFGTSPLKYNVDIYLYVHLDQHFNLQYLVLCPIICMDLTVIYSYYTTLGGFIAGFRLVKHFCFYPRENNLFAYFFTYIYLIDLHVFYELIFTICTSVF